MKSQSWLLDINDPGFDPNADLVADNVIDLQDLKALVDYWLTDGNRSEQYYYHSDGLGSVIVLSNTVGQIVEAYHYDVYDRANTTATPIYSPAEDLPLKPACINVK